MDVKSNANYLYSIYYSKVGTVIITGLDLSICTAVFLFGIACISLLVDGESNMTKYSFGGAILMIILFVIQLAIYNV